MNIPGANLLKLAARALRFETVGHRAFVSRAVNGAGDFVSTFAATADVQGSMQPVDAKLYRELGLDLSKNYITFFTSALVAPLDRDREGDLLTFGGKTWQCQSSLNWAAIDGHIKLLCVEVPPYAG